MTGGWSWRNRACHASMVLGLAGSVLGNIAVPDAVQPFDRAVVTDTTCLARQWWEVEAEVFRYPTCLDTRWDPGKESQSSSVSLGTSVENDTIITKSVAAEATPDVPAKKLSQEQDEDSLLDSPSFLSFEDWKKQNLAKVGQSAENVGGSRRSAAVGKEDRRRLGINNALDSLGDDAEIELDFGGFGAETPEASPTAWGTPISSQYAGQPGGDTNDHVHHQHGPQNDASHRKDAGTTCKERFNYASFDCAATVLKTNPECKGSSAVLVENKDSYMLNECRANNKFLILELCDDILVDTVVLANYEFFSSIFHTFRVSVSDRYPAKSDQWKELGVYEARNTREVQAFAVENSLIWARYLRIEFLTHYGHEFYCPVSLIRVHGTTMMEEYKHDESVSRGEAEIVELVEEVEVPKDAEVQPSEPTSAEAMTEIADSVATPGVCSNPITESVLWRLLHDPTEVCSIHEGPPLTFLSEGTTSTAESKLSSTTDSTVVLGESETSFQSASPDLFRAPEGNHKLGAHSKAMAATPDASVVAAEPVQHNSTTETSSRSTTHSKEDSQSALSESTRATFTQPPPSNPTTQESFFKSVHKRLQMLESNSTLSLLYIEEQSRILRDAFNKVEKRQLAKTSTFLENLNITVLSELKEFREQYDYVWKSVAFEFEHQRVRYHQEVHSLSTQLGVLADELVFQKRVTVIQSVMVLCCFALVLFSRGSIGNYIEFPRVQRMVARSYSMRSSSPLSVSLSASPGSTRPTSSYRKNSKHQRNLSESSSSEESTASPTVAYNPPTPTSEISQGLEGEKINEPHSPDTVDTISVPTLGTPQFRSHSTPPVIGSRTIDPDMDDESEDHALTSEGMVPSIG